MAFEAIETLFPELPIRCEPLVERDQRFGPDPIEAALRVGSHVDEPGFAQDPEVLGDRGLGEPHVVHELVHGALAFPQPVEDPPATGLGEHFEDGVSGHPLSILL
jgi:hypothetical protein